jgi:hypothetical protein
LENFPLAASPSGDCLPVAGDAQIEEQRRVIESTERPVLGPKWTQVCGLHPSEKQFSTRALAVACELPRTPFPDSGRT